MMRMRNRFIPILLLCCTSLSFPYDNEARDILTQAESWLPGQPLPINLTVYRHDGDCMLVDTDTEAIIPRIKNVQLLIALSVDSQADSRVSDEALMAALSQYGPTKVFALLNEQLTKYPLRIPEDRRKKLIKRMTMRHVVIDAASISLKDMPYNEAIQVISKMKEELLRNREWFEVLSEYQQKYEYQATDYDSSLTRVGNMGHFVVFPHKLLGKTYTVETKCCLEVRGPAPTRDFANLDYLPKDHGKRILQAQTGEIFSLKDSINKEVVLYLVKETYK